MINEVWKDIEEYDGLYQVSNMGRVRSLDNYDRLGRLHSKGRIMKPVIDIGGYLRVGLSKKGKVKHFMVHRLVAQAFIPDSEGLSQINHKDEDKTNNIVDNLEYCTAKYNSNYGTHIERQVQTRIRNGNADPELCGLDEKERHRLYYQKNKDRLRERNTEYMRKYRLKKKKNNKPSEESLW